MPPKNETIGQIGMIAASAWKDVESFSWSLNVHSNFEREKGLKAESSFRWRQKNLYLRNRKDRSKPEMLLFLNVPSFLKPKKKNNFYQN